MSTITKEWLQQKIAEMEAARDEIPFSLDEDDSNTLAAMKLAMASLEAEPRGYIDAGTPDDGINIITENKLLKTDIALYTAPPAPVSVPDLLEQFAEFMAAESIKSGDYPDGWQCKASNAAHEYAENIRAAMLQGADTELQRKVDIHDALCEKYNVESLTDFVDWQRNHIAELEAALPAPVGEGETAVMPDYAGYTMTQRECYQAGKKAGLAEAGSYPVAPDGYVLVPVSDSLLSELLAIAKAAANAADECAHAEFGDDSMEHSTAISDWERRAEIVKNSRQKNHHRNYEDYRDRLESVIFSIVRSMAGEEIRKDEVELHKLAVLYINDAKRRLLPSYVMTTEEKGDAWVMRARAISLRNDFWNGKITQSNSPVIPDGWVMVPRMLTPRMITKLQQKTEIGSYIAANWAGAYDLFQKFWDEAIAAAPQQEVKNG